MPKDNFIYLFLVGGEDDQIVFQSLLSMQWGRVVAEESL